MDIKRFIAVCAMSAAIVASGEVAAFAAPLTLAPSSLVKGMDSPIEQARLFCYNRYSGRFLHWGRCGGYRRHYYHHPRVYCMNRYTHRFLHWGSC